MSGCPVSNVLLPFGLTTYFISLELLDGMGEGQFSRYLHARRVIQFGEAGKCRLRAT